MKTINYLCILLICFCLTNCNTNQSELDEIACAYIDSFTRFDNSKLLKLVDDSTRVEINEVFNDLESKGVLKQIQEEMKKYKVSTKVVERDINKEKNFAIIYVKLELKGEETKEIEHLVPFRYVNGHWKLTGL